MSSIVAGPWGGQSGYQWDDGDHSTVRQIVITSATAIDSIQFEYDDNGRSIWSDKHGGSGGIKTDKIKLGHPIEFLISISGHYGPLREGDPVIVRSLSFESNKKKYGPFGIEQGTPFSLPASDGKIVGFHGRSSWYLDAIGVYVMPLMQQNPALSHQPMGHGLPHPDPYGTRTMRNDPYGTRAMRNDPYVVCAKRNDPFTIPAGKDPFPVCAMSDDPFPIPAGKYEGARGMPRPALHDIGAWRDEGDRPWDDGVHTEVISAPQVSKRIVSFGPWGADSGAIFDDGIYTGVREIHISNDPFPIPAGKDEGVWGRPRAAIHDIGLWGAEGGQPWDDGVHTGVRKILLTRSGEAICSIQIEYDRNGQSVWAAQHGAGNEACTHLIKFNYPHEVLTCISGYYDALFGDRRKMVVRSLSFQTNRANYGPYGKAIGTHFSSAKTEGKVIGFHGQSAQFLDAIGVHMQCCLADEVSWPGHIQERRFIRNMLHKIMH